MEKEMTGAAAERMPGGVEITHPDKILFPEVGIAKGDVAQYYEKVAGRMLPYLTGRIMSVVRCPEGVGGDCFYRKHPGDTAGVMEITVAGSGGEEKYGYLTGIDGLLGEVQMNTLEFHTWGCRVEDLEHPDGMVFDLDPDEGLDLGRVRQGARDVKRILVRRGLVGYLKTSGGKGYHVVVPLKASAGWDRCHEFAQDIAKTMQASWPDRYTSEMRKDRREGKIFVDWLRNTRGATTVCPYSVRARAGAPVSMPIAWEELDAVAPGGVTMEGALARLRHKDPWEGFWETGQRLE